MLSVFLAGCGTRAPVVPVDPVPRTPKPVPASTTPEYPPAVRAALRLSDPGSTVAVSRQYRDTHPGSAFEVRLMLLEAGTLAQMGRFPEAKLAFSQVASAPS
ncbi:MAG: hypothetical protein QGH59_02045, partial [Gemmatimonadota bacterium]|nr:hypothetical protein [Gemmatimonadota bacterium]